MAIMKPLLGVQMSGSIGGITFSHNRAGPYTRSRATPVNPNTVYQQAVRSAMAALSAYWGSSLTQEQRDAWDLYAYNVPLTNRLGDPINVGGLGMFQRTNVPVLQTGLGGGTIIEDAPVIFNLGDYTPPSISALTAASNEWAFAFNVDDDWVDEDDSSMLFFTSRPMSPGRNYFKGPYRFAGSIDGDSTTPPTSPATITSPFPIAIAQKAFCRAVVLRADGRYSADFRGGVIAG